MIRRVSLLLVLAVVASGVQAQEAEGPPKLKLGPAIEKQAPDAKQAKRTKPVRKLPIPVGNDLEVMWGDYFATHQDEPAEVREAVRNLLSQSRFDHVVALIHGALRHGQGQPWMHEALGLAMQALGSPQAEIERALLSAIDVQQPNPVNLMYAARYLAANGSPERGLSLYQQAAQMVPNRPEPYEYGLKIAVEQSNIEGIKWATTGILSRAWNGEQTKLWQQAHNVAKATLDQLRAARRFKEANEFNTALNNALVRDVIAIVSWTGEADVDVAVEDPSGSVCTHRNPQTPGGGVLVKDAFARQGAASNKPISESYYCPEGFAGEYKLRLRRVWGKLTAGKVTVDLYSHWGTPDVKHIRREVPVGEEDSLVVFKLKEGRRREPLDDQLIATAAQRQNQVRRELLLQQLDSLATTNPVNSLLAAREFAGSEFPLLNGRGGVGYQPVIIVLSEGASLSAQAVISADRRYVRFTGVPLFTGIGDVTTFNIQSGAQTRDAFQGGGAQGGGGLGGGGDPFGGGGDDGDDNVGGGAGVIVCTIPNVVNNFAVVDLPVSNAVQFAYVIPPSTLSDIDGNNRERQMGNKCGGPGQGLGPTLLYDTWDLVYGGCCEFELYLVRGGQTFLPQTQIPLNVAQSYRVPPGMRVTEIIGFFGSNSLGLTQGYDPVANPNTPGPAGYFGGVGPGTVGMTFPNGGTISVNP